MIEKISHLIILKDWYNTIATDKEDVNYYLAKFMAKINALQDKYIPLKKVSQKDFKRKYKPWITNTILNKIDHKNKIFKKFMKCKNSDQNSLFKDQFNILKNEITSLMRDNKK